MLSTPRQTALLMLVAVSILASSGAVAKESNRYELSSVTGDSGNNKILLRGAKEADNDTEDRGLLAWVRLQYWLETGRSKSYVKQSLELEGLEGAALRSAPNFIYYDDFVYARQGCILENWLDRGVTTQQVWRHYELADIPPAQLKDTDAYKTFVRFAKMEDDKIFSLKNADAEVKIEYGGSPAEMEAKLEMWVLAKRPNWYVKKMLNLDGRSRNAMLKSEYYPYYEKFLVLTGQKKPTIPSVEVSK